MKVKTTVACWNCNRSADGRPCIDQRACGLSKGSQKIVVDVDIREMVQHG